MTDASDNKATNDVVHQLREAGKRVRERGYGDKSTMFDEAADEIERLRTELLRGVPAEAHCGMWMTRALICHQCGHEKLLP